MMKTFYLIKSFLPFVFLPIAPEVIRVELERQGLFTYGYSAFFTVLIQIFTVGIVVWLTSVLNQKNKAKAFLKMSCVSKKVFYQGRWISVEQYLADYHNIVVSHGMTPEESKAWVLESEEWLRRKKNLVSVSGWLNPSPSGEEMIDERSSDLSFQ